MQDDTILFNAPTGFTREANRCGVRWINERNKVPSKRPRRSSSRVLYRDTRSQ